MRNTQKQSMSKYLTMMAVLASLGFLMNCFFASPAMAETGVLLEKIVENRDFFTNSGGLGNYEESLLCDISDLGGDRIGLLLLEPSGILKSLVFNRSTGAKIHEDATISSRHLRNEFARSGISMADARLVAKNIAGFSRGREASAALLPQPAVTPDVNRQKPAMPTSSEDILTLFRDEVSRNPEVLAMDTDYIISRFRAEIQEAKAPS